ncbi:MAG: copper-binding protein [Bryobacterales bacterium]|nr:copper-binding protein [Bryobacterales bacterium]
MMNNSTYFPSTQDGRRLLMPLLLCLMIGLTACGPTASESTEAPSGLSSSRHEIRGIVVSANEEAKEAIIDHEEIPDLMGAMRMGFSIPTAADLEKLKPGTKIKATLVMENNTMWIEAVEVTGQGEVPTTEPAGGGHAH